MRVTSTIFFDFCIFKILQGAGEMAPQLRVHILADNLNLVLAPMLDGTQPSVTPAPGGSNAQISMIISSHVQRHAHMNIYVIKCIINRCLKIKFEGWRDGSVV